MTDEETIEEKAIEYVLATFYEDYSTEEKKDILKENSRYFRDRVNLFIKAYDMGQNDEFEFNNRMEIRNAKKMKELKVQIEKYKTEKNYYDNLCHNKTVECDDLRKGIKQFQSDNDKFIKKIEEIAEENEELKAQIKELKEHRDRLIQNNLKLAEDNLYFQLHYTN